MIVEALAAAAAHQLPDLGFVHRESPSPLLESGRIRQAQGERSCTLPQGELGTGAVDFSQAWQVRARENFLADEVGSLPVCFVALIWHANGLDCHHTTRLQAPVQSPEVDRQVLVANSLDHLHAHSFGEVLCSQPGRHIPVVTEYHADLVLYSRFCNTLLRQLELLPGERDGRPASHFWAALRRPDGQAAPTTADLQHLIAGLQFDEVQQTVHLPLLRELQEVRGTIDTLRKWSRDLKLPDVLVENA
mmetsp:Transcript_20236/g.47587  ORF Transcript_20236/g.47587 Transcript_20236/m.47587 type:complete len:247 (-) Transcript_20236:488-1228(-)